MSSSQLERLKKRFESTPKTIVESVKPALQCSDDELASTMNPLAPEDTGALKESIAVTEDG